ncbi:MAG: glycosyltransferase [Treponemataceae bacterium]|nr:MAG: glycosyltransferase [Treponemataceae bacterium]
MQFFDEFALTMNITIVIDELDMGGAQHVVYLLAKYLDKTEFSITIICTDGARKNSHLEQQMLRECTADGYKIIFLKNRDFVRLETPFALLNKIVNKICRIFVDCARILELCKELPKTQPYVIHVHQHGIWAAYWALPHRIPLVTTIHTTPNVTFPRETEKIALHLSLLFRRNVFAAISQYNLDLIKSFWHLDDAHAYTINNGIELGSYYTKVHDVFSFINVSRQDKNKNQQLIVHAFARLCRNSPEVRLYLVGDGECHEKLKQLAVELGIQEKVVFTGYIASAIEYLSISDAYISSSHREGLPLSVLEAMAAHLPVIATDAGGVRDLAQENGILVADNDEDGLLKAMHTLHDNADLRRQKGEKSFEMVQAFSAENMAAEYGALYKAVLQEAKHKQ